STACVLCSYIHSFPTRRSSDLFVFYNSESKFENKHSREILPENNNIENTVPQILTNKSEDCIKLSELFANWGYKEMNINMGCPLDRKSTRLNSSHVKISYAVSC